MPWIGWIAVKKKKKKIDRKTVNSKTNNLKIQVTITRYKTQHTINKLSPNFLQ